MPQTTSSLDGTPNTLTTRLKSTKESQLLSLVVWRGTYDPNDTSKFVSVRLEEADTSAPNVYVGNNAANGIESTSRRR